MDILGAELQPVVRALPSARVGEPRAHEGTASTSEAVLLM
jgi:hypothetical protein